MLTLMEGQASYLEQGFLVAEQLEQYRKDLAVQVRRKEAGRRGEVQGGGGWKGPWKKWLDLTPLQHK